MNCKQGDLAVVIFVHPKCQTEIRGNSGRIVEVLGPKGMFEYQGYGELFCWYVRSKGTLMQRRDGPGMEGFLPDICLRPLPGDSESESMKEPEEIAA